MKWRFVLLGLVLCCLLPGVASGQEREDPFFGEDPAAEEDIPVLEVRTIEPGLSLAREHLAETYGQFLVRSELGFDFRLIDLIAQDLRQLVANIEEAIRAPTTIDPFGVLSFLGALLTLFLFIIAFLLLERQTTRWAHHVQARTHFDVSSALTAAARKIVLIIGRSAAIPFLILLSFFPVRAAFGPVGWTLLLTDGLILFLAYRVGKTALAALLRLDPPAGEGRHHWLQIEAFALVVLQVTLGFLFLQAAIERFEYHDQAGAFVSFIFRLTLALLPVYLFFIRDSVLSLMPRRSTSRFATTLRRYLDANYNTFVALTILLLLFNAAGYVYAATFLLTRGYALIILGVIWFAGLARLRLLVRTRIDEAREAHQPPSPLLTALENWLVLLGTLFIIVVALRFVGLFDPLVAILQVPFLAIGRVEISIYNLISVVLIIVATVLSIRLVKALLNAKVYPAIGVEVGAAYAFNTLLNYALVVVGFVLSLVALGVHLSAVMVVLASLGVGIGFGLQNIAENLISGFILLFGRAVKKGDFITVNDIYGRVEAVGARSVVVRTPDNFSMLIPSKEIVSGRIINWTFHDYIVRIHIPVGVSYKADPQQVREVLLETATRHPDILQDPPADVWITNFGDNAIEFELLVYFDCRTTNERTLKGKFNFLLWEALKQAGVGIPYPQRDLHLKSIDERIVFPPPPDSRTR